MFVTVGEFKQLIREEYMRGMQEFAVRTAAEKYAKEILQHIQRHVVLISTTPSAQRNAMNVAHEVVDEMIEDVIELTKEKLWKYLQST